MADQSESERREARLAAALRENLKRRKAQARLRETLPRQTLARQTADTGDADPVQTKGEGA